MNVLVIKASPRKHGNTSSLADEIAAGASEAGHECRVFWLPDLNIRDCLGCLACQTKGACVLRGDDMGQIEMAIQWADLIVFATPTHWGNISGHLLRMFERLFGFLIRERYYAVPVALKARGKKAIIVTACSTPWPFSWVYNQSRAVRSRIKEVCRYSGIRIVKTLVFPGTFGRKDIPRRYLDRAKKIGVSL
jgi:multimeric flavodoxin WrbA